MHVQPMCSGKGKDHRFVYVHVGLANVACVLFVAAVYAAMLCSVTYNHWICSFTLIVASYPLDT